MAGNTKKLPLEIWTFILFSVHWVCSMEYPWSIVSPPSAPLRKGTLIYRKRMLSNNSISIVSTSRLTCKHWVKWSSRLYFDAPVLWKRSSLTSPLALASSTMLRNLRIWGRLGGVKSTMLMWCTMSSGHVSQFGGLDSNRHTRCLMPFSTRNL